MADDFTDDSIAVEDAPDFSTESVAVEPLPSPSHPPAIRDEPLPAEDTYVSHLALPLPLRPLPPITSERLTVPEPSGPSVFERFNRLGQPVYDTPTEPPVDVFSQRDKGLIEDTRSRMVLKDRIEKVGSPVSTGLRESAVSGIQGLASNTGLAAAAGVAVAPQIVVPALFAATVPQVPEVIERIQKAREEGDRPAYYRAVGDALQTFAVLGVTLPSTLRLPRSLDAWRESVGARAEARFQAAKDITPRPPLQLPERFVEPPTTGGPSAVPIRKTTPLLRDVPEQQVERQPEVPATPSAGGVSPSVKGPEETPKPAAVPLTDPVGNAPEFYSLPRLRALDRIKDPRLAAAKKYYGAKTVPELARLAKARFDEMAAKAKPVDEPKPEEFTESDASEGFDRNFRNLIGEFESASGSLSALATIQKRFDRALREEQISAEQHRYLTDRLSERLKSVPEKTSSKPLENLQQPVTKPIESYGDRYVREHGIQAAKDRVLHLSRRMDEELAARNFDSHSRLLQETENLQRAIEKVKPLETREDAEMKRVQALPEGPEGEAQLVAEDIAKAVETVDVSDVAGVSPVPALVRIIRRAARDPAMKTAAEQAMQKIGAAAREQGVPLDTIKQEIAGELKAIYGDDAAEMAKAFFGEEPKTALSAPAEQPAAPVEVMAAEPSENYKAVVGQEVWDGYHNRRAVVTGITTGQVKVRFSDGNEVWVRAEAIGPKRGPAARATIDVEGTPAAPASEAPATPAPAATAETAADFASKLDAYSPADRLIIQRTIETNANNPLLSAWKREWLRVNAIRREASAGPKALAVGESAKAGPTTRSGPPPAKAEEGARETATHPPATERIVATAVRNPSTGQIAFAPNKIHVQLYNEVGLDPTRLSSKQVAESSGYMTDRGRFVTQDEGQRLAQEAKQIGAREELMGEVVKERLSKTAARPAAPLTQAKLSAIEAKLSRREKLTANEESRLKQAQEASDASRATSLEAAISALPPEQRALVRSSQAAVLAQQEPVAPAPVATAKAQAEVSRVAATEGKRSAKEIKDDLVKELTKAWAEAPNAVDAAKPTVTISIPGDGEFTLTNTSAAIESVLKRAKKIQTSTEAKTFFPRGAVESSAKAIQSTFTPKPEPPKPGPGATGSVGFFPRRSEALGMGEASMPPTVEDVRRQRQRDLAPPPSEPPPSQPSPPPETPEAAITDAPKPKDVMPARNWWTSSEFEFQTIPEAAPLVTKLVEAELGFGAQVGRDIQRFNEIKANLSKAEQIQVTKALREAQKGNPALLEALPENLRTAADEVRNYFEDVKKVIIAEKKRELIEALPDARGRAVQDILGGMPEAQAFRRNRLRAAGQATVRSAIQELKELDNWGPEDYVTNIERGSYRVVDPNGTTVAIALTPVVAKEKALQYAKEHPNVKSLTITDEFDPGIESPTKLSKGQYYRTISRLSQAVGETASEVQRLLRADGSIIAIKPTNKYAGPLQRRRNILKGEENLWDALPTYAYSVRKKLALDPVLKEVRESLNTLPENARQQVEELANDVKGRKTVADKIVDYLLSPLGTQPFGYSRGVNLARRITTIAKLGYRPVTALINRLSGMQHTWTRAGTQWFLEGRRFMNTPEFKEVWEANRDYVGDAATAFTEGARQGAVPWWHPLSMFQWAEHVNRPEAFATFYRFAQGELKMSPLEAAAYARWQTRFAQFVYTTGSLPRMFRGPTGRLVGQFKPYLVRELEFLSSLDSRQWPRYLAGFMALGGPRAVVYMLRSLPFLGAAGVFYAIEDWLNRKAPATSRGVGGAVGVDVTAAVTPQFPSRSEDWAGPTLSSLVTLYRDIIEPAMSGEKRDVRDLAQWGAKLAPMTSYWYDLVESALHREGWNVDAQGRPDYKPSTADKIKMAVGAQPLEKSIQAVESRYLNHLDDITRANRKHLVDRFIRALDANDPEEMDRMIAQFADYGITSDTIKDAMKQRHREPRERLRQRLLKVLRPTLAEREAENP